MMVNDLDIIPHKPSRYCDIIIKTSQGTRDENPFSSLRTLLPRKH